MASLFTSYMEYALTAAYEAEKAGDIPIGACVVDSASGKVIARSGNRIEQDNDPTAHAEMVVIRQASQFLNTRYLSQCDLYVTLEPCAMCAQAISLARLRRVYFGAYDEKGGGVNHGARIFSLATCHHVPEVYGGISEQICSKLLQDFFKRRRT